MVFSTRGQIASLAASGNLVAAVTTHIKGANDRIVVWSAPGKKFTRIDTHVRTARPTGVFEGAGGLALGGGRVAWITSSGGNTEQLGLLVAPASGGPSKGLDSASNGSGAGAVVDGDYLGQLFGAGHLLFYNRWHVCSNEESGGPTPECPVDHEISQAQLLRISGGVRVRVKRGPSAFRLLAVGGDRVALQAEPVLGTVSGAVAVLTESGAPLATIPASAGDPPRAVSLGATHLVILRAHALEAYTPASGTLIRTIPLGTAASLQLAGVNSKLALLRGLHKLVLVRLSDGQWLTFPLAAGALACACPVDAELNETGLFYAYNVPTTTAKGRIVFEPTQQLLARF